MKELLFDKITDIDWFKITHSCGNSIFLENTKTFIENHNVEKRITNTLDNIFTNKIFELIKIDCQGSELPILKGGENLLKNTTALILELPFLGEYNKNVPSFCEHIKFLDKIGFVPFDIAEIHNIGFINQIDILFIKKTSLILSKVQKKLEVWNIKN